MAWTATDLAAVEAAIASGALRVRFGDREVTYRSIEELTRARDVIKAAVDPTIGAATSCTFASFSKD